jgi:hypothetical protein
MEDTMRRVNQASGANPNEQVKGFLIANRI